MAETSVTTLSWKLSPTSSQCTSPTSPCVRDIASAAHISKTAGVSAHNNTHKKQQRSALSAFAGRAASEPHSGSFTVHETRTPVRAVSKQLQLSHPKMFVLERGKQCLTCLGGERVRSKVINRCRYSPTHTQTRVLHRTGSWWHIFGCESKYQVLCLTTGNELPAHRDRGRVYFGLLLPSYLRSLHLFPFVLLSPPLTFPSFKSSP